MFACRRAATFTASTSLIMVRVSRRSCRSRFFVLSSLPSRHHTTASGSIWHGKLSDHLAVVFTLLHRRAAKGPRSSSPCRKTRLGSNCLFLTPLRHLRRRGFKENA